MSSISEKQFILEGLKMGIRLDGRALTDTKDFIVSYGTVPEAFGSCTVVTQDNIQIVCAIKPEIVKPMDS